MSDLSDLYQDVILDHYKRPRNRGHLDDTDHQADGQNPLCGDHVTVFVKVKDDRVEEIRFAGSGCAISTASASLMTETVKGKTLDEAKAFFRKFHDMVTGSQEVDHGDGLGKLEVFSGVCQYPVRVKCATLAWHTLDAALENREEPVSTE
ncbi:MAG: SUF system NifU family Fe-S cluster assembly protein [Phycisphaerales bacterium]|nr:MAG: SUF system NifU family Fe-S cluster assembly protein [Phycisphaerales bacterium]